MLSDGVAVCPVDCDFELACAVWCDININMRWYSCGNRYMYVCMYVRVPGTDMWCGDPKFLHFERSANPTRVLLIKETPHRITNK